MHALPRHVAPRSPSNLGARWQRACAGLLLLLVLLLPGLALRPAMAAPIPWQESDDIQLMLGTENFAYAGGTTVTLTFKDSVLSNNMGQAQHAGLYFGWLWLQQRYWDPASTEIALPWSNGTQSYTGSDTGNWGANVAVTLSGATAAGALPSNTLLLGSLPAPSSTGTGWAPLLSGSTPITALDDWVVPLLDLGTVAANGDVLFDLIFTLDFSAADPLAGPDAEALAQDWYIDGGYSFWAQGLRAVPEPGSLALVGCALAAAAFVVRRRRTAAA